MRNPEVESALLKLHGITQELEYSEPWLVNIDSCVGEIDKYIHTLLQHRERGKAIHYYLESRKVLSNVAELKNKYQTAMFFKKQKITLEERLLKQIHSTDDKIRVHNDIGNDLSTLANMMHKCGLDDTSALMLAYVHLENAYNLANEVDDSEFKMIVLKNFEYTAYRLAKKKSLSFDPSNVQDIYLDKDIALERLEQIRKLNHDDIKAKWRALKKQKNEMENFKNR